MIRYLKIIPQLIQNMGWDYVSFRAMYEIKRKAGLLKRSYPTSPPVQSFIKLSDWKTSKINFFFDSKERLSIPLNPSEKLESDFNKILEEEYLFFNSTYITVKNYNWITNPDTGYKYSAEKHWTEIDDIIDEAGDIKFVWELSRFSFLYTIIRYDYHFQKDCSELVFSKIEDWIDANPINCGPNYKCSQEIGLRILNWTFALFYYKNSASLTEELFAKILHHIHWQTHHIYHNIQFSLKSVRNNHAISETAALYLIGMLYPFFPSAEQWKNKGKTWVEKEINYQVYQDGTYLMFSTNYHRTVLQVFTWIVYLSNANQEPLAETSKQKIFNSINFLYQCQNNESGHLPNYGHNDGSLFCKLNNNEFRNFKSQLNAAYYYFTDKHLFEEDEFIEETSWYSGNKKKLTEEYATINRSNLSTFEIGGYYLIRDEETLTFIRCGSHKDRPSQADNLHLDLWYNGENILRDAGTYKYNTSPDLVEYFSSTKAHNTVTLGDHDQMKKGPRFIWLNWSKAKEAALEELNDEYKFSGLIQAFGHIDKNISHKRTITKRKGTLKWKIEDEVQHDTKLPIKQYWNLGENFMENFTIEAFDTNGNLLKPMVSKGWYSGLYGVKESTQVIVFQSEKNYINTIIQKK